MPKSLNTKLIQTSSEFSSLKDEWKDFEKTLNHSNITSSYDWLFTWWNVFKNVNNNSIGYDKELKLICLYEKDKLVLIAPFIKVKRKYSGLKVSFFEFLGQQWGGNYLDFICDRKKSYLSREVLYWLHKNERFDIIFFKYIPDDSNSFKREEINLYAACPQIEINNYLNYTDFVKETYSKKLRQNLRTAFNKSKKMGMSIETTIESLDNENFNRTIEISKTKLLDGKNFLYQNKAKKLFMREITNKMHSNVVFVKMDNKKVAYRSNILFNNSKFCIDASFDRDYKKFDLGIISVDASIQDSFSKCLRVHCLGPGVDFYKKKFAKQNVNLFIFIKKGNTYRSYLIYKLIRILVLRKEKAARQSNL